MPTNKQETAANNLGLHLTELQQTIKHLQADLALSQGTVGLMALYFVQYLRCVPCPVSPCDVSKVPLEDCISRFQEYFIAKAKTREGLEAEKPKSNGIPIEKVWRGQEGRGK